jgi:GNAT superfamily N-acetyltransferase
MHIFFRRPWRGCGLAGVLLTSSLRILQERGMAEAEQGVDRENESAAHAFYKRMGFRPETTDVWYRKPIECGLTAGR